MSIIEEHTEELQEDWIQKSTQGGRKERQETGKMLFFSKSGTLFVAKSREEKHDLDFTDGIANKIYEGGFF